MKVASERYNLGHSSAHGTVVNHGNSFQCSRARILPILPWVLLDARPDQFRFPIVPSPPPPPPLRWSIKNSMANLLPRTRIPCKFWAITESLHWCGWIRGLWSEGAVEFERGTFRTNMRGALWSAISLTREKIWKYWKEFSWLQWWKESTTTK